MRWCGELEAERFLASSVISLDEDFDTAANVFSIRFVIFDPRLPVGDAFDQRDLCLRYT